MKFFKLLLLTLSIATFTSNSIFALNLAQQADSAYNKDNFSLAIELYKQALSEQGRNATLYYNLGNAEYRQGHIAEAVLAYERALRVDPSFADARTNLDFVRTKLQDKPEDNNSILQRAHSGLVRSMSANGWAFMAIAVFFVMLGFAAIYIFSSNVASRKVGFFGGIIALFVTIYFIVVAHDAWKRIDDHSEAIVTVPSTLLNSSPRQPKQTEKVVPLHEGTKVEIVDSVATPDDPVSPRWYKVKINGSNSAWLRATDVTRI